MTTHPFTDAVLHSITLLTDRNAHTEARLEIALKLPGHAGAEFTRQMEAIRMAHQHIGHMPRGLDDWRHSITEAMLAEIAKLYGAEVRAAVYAAL